MAAGTAKHRLGEGAWRGFWLAAAALRNVPLVHRTDCHLDSQWLEEAAERPAVSSRDLGRTSCVKRKGWRWGCNDGANGASCFSTSKSAEP